MLVGNDRWEIAVGRSGRTAPLLDGEIGSDEPVFRWHARSTAEMFAPMLRHGAWDASEMSFTYQLMAHDQGAPRLVSLPVFLWRLVRHGDLYVRADETVREPGNLEGRPFGVPDFHGADGLWIRGMLRETYGVNPRRIEWVQLQDQRRMPHRPYRDYHVVMRPGADGEALLKSGEIDAMFVAGEPAAFARGESWIRRLFPDAKAAEQGYYRATRLLPLLHGFVVRQDRHEAHPDRTAKLCRLFVRARDRWYEQIRTAQGPVEGLPWHGESTVAETEAIIGRDFWPYGIESNRHELETAIRWSLEDGIISRPPDLSKLFVTPAE